MAFLKEQFPMEIKISFNKLVKKYHTHLEGNDVLLKERAKRIFSIVKKHPLLIEGLSSFQEIKKYQSEIDAILADLFSGILQDNEIKVASLPFQAGVIKTSKRYDRIIAEAGSHFEPELKNFNKDYLYIMGCSLILNFYYGYDIDFNRLFYYDIPDMQGVIKHYSCLLYTSPSPRDS